MGKCAIRPIEPPQNLVFLGVAIRHQLEDRSTTALISRATALHGCAVEVAGRVEQNSTSGAFAGFLRGKGMKDFLLVHSGFFPVVTGIRFQTVPRFLLPPEYVVP